MKRFLLNSAWKFENRFRNRGPGNGRFAKAMLKTYGALFAIAAIFGIDAGVAASLGLFAAWAVDSIVSEPSYLWPGPRDFLAAVGILSVPTALLLYVFGTGF